MTYRDHVVVRPRELYVTDSATVQVQSTDHALDRDCTSTCGRQNLLFYHSKGIAWAHCLVNSSLRPSIGRPWSRSPGGMNDCRAVASWPLSTMSSTSQMVWVEDWRVSQDLSQCLIGVTVERTQNIISTTSRWLATIYIYISYRVKNRPHLYHRNERVSSNIMFQTLSAWWRGWWNWYETTHLSARLFYQTDMPPIAIPSNDIHPQCSPIISGRQLKTTWVEHKKQWTHGNNVEWRAMYIKINRNSCEINHNQWNKKRLAKPNENKLSLT